MAGKPVLLLPLADRDIQEAIRYYRREGGSSLAHRWTKAIESAMRHIAVNPGTGSLRYQSLLNIPDLRFWPVGAFPYLVFYVERQECVEIWRVLHGQRDLPNWLAQEEIGALGLDHRSGQSLGQTYAGFLSC